MDEIKRIRGVYEDRISRNLSERYSLFRPGELYMLQRREAVTLRMLRKAGWQSLRNRLILEVGCGRGNRLADFQRWGADPRSLHGVDLMQAFAREASTRYPNYNIAQSSGHRLPYRSGSFDLVAQSTVFTSVLDVGLRREIAREMCRVLKPDGLILWYDFRYPNPRNAAVSPLGAEDIRLLFPDMSCTILSVTLLPPIARRVAPISFLACRCLELIPPLRSHCLAIATKKRQES